MMVHNKSDDGCFGECESAKKGNQRVLRCFLIGDGSLCVECAALLLKHDHRILGIITEDPDVISWARNNNIPTHDPTQDLFTFLKRHKFDYLFSINSALNLSEAILGLPEQLSIGFQDSLLPEYAGWFPTSWAIMNGEVTHGVSWFVMTGSSDVWPVLEELPISVSKSETAISLNAKCFEAGIASFEKLIKKLEIGRIHPRELCTSKGEFFPPYRRPPACCLIDWSLSADEIDAFVRALNFGSYSNPLGLPKILINNEAYIPENIEISSSRSNFPPGTVSRLEDEFMVVSTATDDVIIRKLCTVDGIYEPFSVLREKHRLKPGDILDSLSIEASTCITAYHEKICSHESFWVERLKSLQPFSFSKVRLLPQKPSKSSWEKLEFPSPLPENFRDYSSIQVPFHVSVIAAFAAFLMRLEGTGKFHLGFRYRELTDHIAGIEQFFASHLPLAVDMAPEDPFNTVVKRIYQEINNLQRHETYVRDVPSRYPALRSLPEGWRTNPSNVLVELSDSPQNPKVDSDAALAMVVSERGPSFHWYYRPETFAKDTVRQMAEQFITFCSGIVQTPEAPIGGICLLTGPEREAMLLEYSRLRKSFPKERCIHQLFEEQVAKTPENIAIAFGNTRLTYRELNKRANQVANHLIKLEIRSEDIVALYLERSVEMLVGILGVLKTGAAYLPLDQAHPGDRLAFMLEDANVAALITQAEFLDRIPGNHTKTLCLDRDRPHISLENLENPNLDVTPDNLAHVIYTSGSTGKPKGVLVSHYNVIRLFQATDPYFRFNEHDVWTLFHSYAFDFSVWEIWGALLFGGKLIPVPYLISRSPEAFYELLEKEEVTILNQTPSAFRQLMKVEESLEKIKNLKLRIVILGGEVLEFQSLKPWFDRHGDTKPRLYNIYGPTETSIFVTFRPVSEKDLTDSPGSLIGWPVEDTQVYLLDSNMNPVPYNVPGEIYVGGSAVTRGYLNRDELNSERFIANPFSGNQGGRLYRTGDIARMLPDKDILYHGRIDNQVKIRGFRIELEEIESVICEHPAVFEAAVVCRETTPGFQQLIAYVVPKNQGPFPARELRGYLKAKLPEYMVPSSIVCLGALPLNINGKVDRSALPEPASVSSPRETSFAPPENRIEAAIAQIYQEILGVGEVGIEDNFFELGGNSLLVGRVVTALQRVLNTRVEMVKLFEFPTIRSLARYLEKQNPEEPLLEKVEQRAKRQKEAFARRKEMQREKIR